MSFSQSKYLQSIPRKIAISIIVTHVIFRGIRYASNVANFELLEINNIFKCSGSKTGVCGTPGGPLRVFRGPQEAAEACRL